MNKAPKKPSAMQPGIHQGASPPFHNLGEYTFQDLCRDRFDEEPNIATCEHYGVRGQGQDGIDLKAFRKNGKGTEVGQCKCHKQFPPQKIREASDAFFEHWDDHWSKEDVRRFILFVACDMRTKQRQDEIQKQWDRFAMIDITYEVWSAGSIRNKLRPYRAIVGRYCYPADYWIEEICGIAPADSRWHEQKEAQISVVVESALLERISQLTTEATERELAQMRKAFSRGDKKAAFQWIKSTKEDEALWTGLNPHVKAKVLRFEAGVILDTQGETVQARQLIEDAYTLSPEDDSITLRAMVLYRDGDSDAALKILDGNDSVEALNLKAAIMLERGDVMKTLEILDFKNIEARER